MLAKRHGLNFEIPSSVQLPTNPVIQGHPNVCSAGSAAWLDVLKEIRSNSDTTADAVARVEGLNVDATFSVFRVRQGNLYYRNY